MRLLKYKKEDSPKIKSYYHEKKMDIDPALFDPSNHINVLTSEDPVSIFAKNKEGPLKFVYLNQVCNAVT